MKYLKLYEYYSGKLYKLMRSTQEIDQFMSRNKCEIPNREMKKIKDALNNGVWNYCNKFDGPSPFEIIENPQSTSIKLYPIIKRNIMPSVFISYWEDEYYLITYIFSISGNRTYKRYYKCDQVDGIVEFINDMNNGNIPI